ncbi:MAG: hypothetical protein IIC01_11390, partial [Planctomycetes bacterium]|nr:hypothetical protein [Planctomycetota bacterium]
GIGAGERNGPLDPLPKAAGVVLAGDHPVAVDLAAARIMGFDYRRLPLLWRALEDGPLPLASFAYDDLLVRSNDSRWNRRLAEFDGPGLVFEPHFGWKGHIELAQEPTVRDSVDSCAG